MRTAWFGFGVTALAATMVGCASTGGDTDSESHFQCSADAECTGQDERTACVEHVCERPGRKEQALSLTPDEDPGPAVDCSGEWPADTASFETTENRLPPSLIGSLLDPPRLNRNGTVLVGAVTVSSKTEGTETKRYGHVIRWTSARLAWLGQPVEAEYPSISSSLYVSPEAVSCDGMTIVGNTSSAAFRWLSVGGFHEVTYGLLPPTEERVLAVSPDGYSKWGLRSVDPIQLGSIHGDVVRWDYDLPEVLFTLPDAGLLNLGFSADGSTIFGRVADFGDHFVQTVGSEPRYLGIATDVDRSGFPRAISSDGKVVAGDRELLTPEDRWIQSYVWIDGGIEELPAKTQVYAVTPTGVVVGTGMSDSESPPVFDFVWDRVHGARRLREILASHGVVVSPAVRTLTPTSISDDGRVIAGTCEDDTNGQMFFRAVLPAGAFD